MFTSTVDKGTTRIEESPSGLSEDMALSRFLFLLEVLWFFVL
jgi:hypothetical protein